MKTEKSKIVQEKLNRVVGLLTKQYMREMKSQKTNDTNYINEFGRKVATEIIEETIDDMLMETEMLIDEMYGEVPLDSFKREWLKISSKFEKKFQNILKNMSTR